MDIDPQNFFLTLNKYSKNSEGPVECSRLLSVLNYNLTEEQIDASLLDLYCVYMFNKVDGIFLFIENVASNSSFNSPVITSLEIIYALINNFSEKIEKYVLVVNENCLKIFLSKAAAIIKVKACDVLLLSLQKIDKCLENQEAYLTIFNKIRNLCVEHADSIKEKEYMILGMFAKRFSYLLANPENLKLYFITELDRELAKQVSQGLIAGLFIGLEYYCESHPIDVDRDAKLIERLYGYIKIQSNPIKMKKTANRAAIHFFGKNMNVFIKKAIKEYKQWHKRLYSVWFTYGTEEIKVAEFTLKHFLIAVAQFITKTKTNENLTILKHFIGWIKSLLKLESPSTTDKRLAIQALKYFSEPLYQYYPREEAQEIFLIVMQNFENNYIFNDSDSGEDLDILPDYIQCLSSFIRYQNITTMEFYCLEKAVINMIKSFHKLKPLNHYVVIESVINSLIYLKNTKFFKVFLENIIYQGIIWTCSHQHQANSELVTDNENIITIKNYFPFWQGLLSVASTSLDFTEKRHLQIKIVNQIIKTMLILVNKLNINIKQNENSTEMQIENAYMIVQEDDFAIFLNVTDLYQEFFRHIDAQILSHCICKLINYFVVKCLKHPLISSFYKFLSLMLKNAYSLELFHEENNQDIETCKETLKKFTFVLIHKMKQFKDELLIACLQVLLECPVVVIEPILPDCADVFTTVFEVGRSYIALANLGLDTLERWQKVMNKEEFSKFLVQVIPQLDSYLRSKSLGGLTQFEKKEKRRKTARALKNRKVLVELEPELLKFQRKILNFIGSQDTIICQAFVCPDVNFERKVTSTNLHLKLTLPYRDLTLDIYVEHFIMRVVELSLYCSDRKTRIMACELLQAFVMIFLGRSKTMTDPGLSDLQNLWKSLCMPLLQLSCDVDQIVMQLFEPLFMQLIHWYTSKQQRETKHSAVLIDTLMEGVTHPTNTSVRDFSAKCMNEFIKWTIKNTTDKELKKNPLYIDVLVKNIKFFCTHADLNKKLGAALIFNNIYKELREQDCLLSTFFIELIHSFVTSLSLIDWVKEEVEPTVVQINASIQHLKRIFIEKHNVISQIPSERIPSDIDGPDVTSLLKWILKTSASRSKYCRDTCTNLFINLVHLSPHASANYFVLNNGLPAITFFEEHVTPHPVLSDALVNVSSIMCNLLKWMQGFWCLLDGYAFIITNNLCDINVNDKSTILFRTVSFYLDNIALNSTELALKALVENPINLVNFTMEDQHQFSTLKSACSIAILKLAGTIITNHQSPVQSHLLWTDPFWNLIIAFLFNPVKLGLDDANSMASYKNELEGFLNGIPGKLPEDKITRLTEVLKDNYVVQNINLNVDFKTNASLQQRGILKGLITIEQSEFDAHFKTETFSKGIIDKLMDNFYRNQDQNTICIGTLSDTVSEFCSLILDFALPHKSKFQILLNHLFKDLTVMHNESLETEEGQMFGIYIIEKFDHNIVRYIFERFDLFLTGSDNIAQVVKLTAYLINYLKKAKKDFKDHFDSILTSLLERWTVFQKYFEGNKVELGIDFIKTLLDVFGDRINGESTTIQWILNLVNTEQDVSLYLNIFYIIAEISVEFPDIKQFIRKINDKLSATKEIAHNQLVSEKMLSVLPVTRNLTVYKSLIELYGSKHSDLTNLLRPFVLHNNEDNNRSILRITYNIVMNENDFHLKNLLTENILNPIMRFSSYSAFNDFMKANIKEILDDLKGQDCGKGIVSCLLIEMLFLRISMENHEVLSRYYNISIKMLLSILFQKFKMTAESDNFEELRTYKCSVYKALVSIITNSIKDVRLYEKLFTRQENNEDILWSSVIDTQITYTFTIDFDSYPKQKKKLVSIRNQLRQQHFGDEYRSLRYIESPRLLLSSLSEDITKYDFSKAILRSHPRTEDANSEDQRTDVQNELYLEATDLNNHELMATVIGLINHMFNSGLNTLPEDDEEMIEFPKWLEGIRNLLLDPSTNKNIKLFWVKVIINTKEIFNKFAKQFTEPLLKFIVDKVAGDEINYYVSDVVVLLASWATTLNEIGTTLATEVITFLIEKINNDRQDVFKYNLELFKLLVENWKGSIEVAYDALQKKIDHTDRKVEVGLYLAAVFLVNNILPCERENVAVFWNKLLTILNSNISTIYKPCSEVLGLILKYMKAEDDDDIVLSKQITRMIYNRENVDKYAKCLESITIHYPEIIDTFHFTKMFDLLAHSNPGLQATFLKIILARADHLSEYNDFKMENWPMYLESQNPDVLLLSLEIMIKTFHLLKADKSFKKILETVSKNLSNPSDIPRIRMYDLMMVVYKNVEDQEINDLCREVLLQGLSDSSVDIREKLREYWSDSSNVPDEITKKFPELMSKFYLAKTEDQFLGNVSYLLLNSLKQDECDKELFEHPLEHCNFEDYVLQTNWRLQHQSVIPLFAQTLKTYSEDSETTFSDFNNVRATQDYSSFAPTQQENWNKYISSVTSLSSSFAEKKDNTFLNPNDVQLSHQYRQPKRRFLKDKSKISKNFANIAIADRIKKIVKRKDAIKEREKKVTIYRSYRRGDFPDIQITLESVIKPLRMLILHDGELAKQFFSVLFKVLVAKQDVGQDFATTMSRNIKYIFENSTQFNTNLFSTLLDVVLLSKDKFWFDPALISTVCQQSGLVPIGTLILEEYLMDLEIEPSSSKEAALAPEKKETDYWIKLAELYRELLEWDLVKTIFVEKTNCKEDIKTAVQFESEQKWRDAFLIYFNLIATDLSLERKDFYFESYFKCTAHLGEWDKVPSEITKVIPEKTTNIWDTLWNKDWYQQKLLPWYIGAEVKNSIFSGTCPNAFLQNINNALGNREQTDYLKSKFSEELSILWIKQGDAIQASQYQKAGLDNFLTEWQLLNPMLGSLRYNKLLDLRTLVEIGRFLDVHSKLADDDGEGNMKYLLEYWDATKDEYLPSIVLNEARLLYRKLFIDALTEKVGLFEMEEAANCLKDAALSLEVAFMNAAIEEENFYMTRKYAKLHRPEENASMKMIYGNLCYLYSKIVNDDKPELKVQKLKEALDHLKDVGDCVGSTIKILTSRSRFVDIHTTLETILSNQAASVTDQSLHRSFSEQNVVMVQDVQNIKKKMADTAFTLSKESWHSDIKDLEQIRKTLLKLAYMSKKDGDEYTFILAVLRAMKLGSKEARQLFPCILQNERLADDLLQVFLEETLSIPTWMFLTWIPQLLANLDSEKVGAIAEIVMRIAKTYPQSIMYAYRLSKKNYADTSNLSNDKLSNVLACMDELLLNNSLVDQFLTALTRVTVPSSVIGHYIKKIKTTSNMTKIMQIKQEILEYGQDEMTGKVFKYMNPLIFAVNKITKGNTPEQASKIVEGIKFPIQKTSALLKDYCPWLANFQASRQDEELEIPGQYTGDKLPLMQHHVKISSFHDRVEEMKSIRKPIKITMIGMNSKEYSFLVKFGEDIRQDQRIEQLFGFMNGIFATDNKNHEVLTYQVVPLSPNLGIIQWVENIVPLDKLMEQSIASKKLDDIMKNIGKKYERYFLKRNIEYEAYGSTAIKRTKAETVMFYQQSFNQIPLDIFRTSIWSLSLTTESYIGFRNNFIKSYAAMCACNWILGIGDRHPQNIQVSLRTGMALGIDFGYAFGTSTQILPIPELVPIRLTPHIVELMAPLKEKGVFRDILISCLKSLRQNKTALEALMDVFIQEPTIDWLDRAREFDHLRAWFPQIKIEQASSKLNGASSRFVLIKNLEQSTLNKIKPEYCEKYISCVRDCEKRKCDGILFNVEQQVDILIDHATDYNLLGRMFKGWAPYV